MDNEKIKQMLLDIKNTELEFEVVQSGKESKMINGLYKPETREIVLHNKNFKTDNELVYTAVHEYTHHLINEERIKENGGKEPPHEARCHTKKFWVLFDSLLEIAEKKGYYSINISASPELETLTQEIKEKYIKPNGQLMIEFGKALVKAQTLCEQANIRYEDYIDRVLQLPRSTEKSVKKVSVLPDDFAPLGFDNMKIIASTKKPDERTMVKDAITSGKSPNSVSALMNRKSKEEDPKIKLEKEKVRLTKTISELTQRLEYVEESLANL